MTNQEAFDIVTINLLAQNAKSIMKYDSDSCAYRGSNGLKCAIGFLIADEDYTTDMEIGSYTIHQIIRNNMHKPSFKKLSEIKPGLINRLQDTHDEYDVENWKEALTEIAKEYKLKINF